MEAGKQRYDMDERQMEVEAVEASVKRMKDFTSPEDLYTELIQSIRKYHPSTDISMIEKAYRVASEAHKEQKRKSGGALYYPSLMCGDHSGRSGTG